MSAPILSTKLFIPLPRPGIVPRPRLIDQLNEGLTVGHKLALISAPAGFGKSTLVSEWIATSGYPVAWFSLGEEDNDLTRFLVYFIAALQTKIPAIGEGVLGLLQSPQPPSTESILSTLINEISTISDTFIFVFDDYHSIDSKPIDKALTFLIEHLPPQMRLVIITREDPDLPLARLRARNQLTELRAAELQFSEAESAEFLNRVMGLDLSVEDIAALETRTEGWITGLHLAALSMQGQTDRKSFIESFTGSHNFVLDYLMEEVLKQQPKAIQSFLLHTSAFERLCGPLCDAVLSDPSGSGQITLDYLDHANLFIIRLDNERHWYRYHHLFRDLLRQRLVQQCPSEELAELHTRASEWLEKNGLQFEAFLHATKANDVERAERLIESEEIGLHLRSVAVPVLDWLSSLRKSVLDASPRLWVRSATTALVMGQSTDVEEKLQAAEASIAAQSASQYVELDEQTRDLVGQIACARATLALFRYDSVAMVFQARRALEYLYPDNLKYRFNANWALTSALIFQGDRIGATFACQECIDISQKSGHVFSKILAASNMGALQEMGNQLYQATETYQQVLQLFDVHPQPNASIVLLGLARIYYEWNDLTAAEQYGLKSLELSRLLDSMIDRFIVSEVFLSRLKLARGDIDGAAEQLAEAEQTARQKKFLLRLPEIAAAQVSVLLRQGQVVAAAQLVQQYELPLCQARVALAQGKPSVAVAILEPFRRQMESKGWVDEQLKATVLLAVSHSGAGEQEKAMQLVCEALKIAEPGGFIRLFIDEGVPMSKLLSAATAQRIKSAYTNKLLSAFGDNYPTAVSQGTSSLYEGLSPREMDILQLLAEGLSNQEIGTKLFLALDTVKGHNRRIFEKLQVKRRTEAIARARELGLI